MYSRPKTNFLQTNHICQRGNMPSWFSRVCISSGRRAHAMWNAVNNQVMETPYKVPSFTWSTQKHSKQNVHIISRRAICSVQQHSKCSNSMALSSKDELNAEWAQNWAHHRSFTSCLEKFLICLDQTVLMHHRNFVRMSFFFFFFARLDKGWHLPVVPN